MSIAGLDEKLVEAVCHLLCQKAATHEHFMSDVVVKMARRGYEILVHHPDCSLSIAKMDDVDDEGYHLPQVDDPNLPSDRSAEPWAR